MAIAESKARGDAEKGFKIPMPSDPKERAEYESAIARRKAAGGGKYVGDDSDEPDPRKVNKYTVSGTFYNPSSADKDGTFEETVEGDEMSEAGAGSAFYTEHSKKYPHYKITGVKKHEAEDDEAKKDASPRHDGETARAGALLRSDMISRTCDVALQVAERMSKRMDAEETMYVKFDAKGGKIKIASEADREVEAAAKKLGLWDGKGSFPGFTLYRGNTEIGGG